MAGQPGRVVIVGAGPAGMALAYLLARRGVGVTVLEMHHDFARVFRGEGLQRSGIDAFRQMGLGEQFDRVPHIVMQFIEIYSGGRRVVRADGRHAATRKHSGFPELSVPQGYDVLWLKVPYADGYPDRTTALVETAGHRTALAFPTADGQLQVGFIIPKGGYAALRARGA